MSKPVSLNWTCHNCGEEFCLSVEPITPAQVSGPPESCYPEEGGDYEPTECPTCNDPIPAEKVHERLGDHYDNIEEQRNQDYEK